VAKRVAIADLKTGDIILSRPKVSLPPERLRLEHIVIELTKFGRDRYTVRTIRREKSQAGPVWEPSALGPYAKTNLLWIE
jgi:hypothetical protein